MTSSHNPLRSTDGATSFVRDAVQPHAQISSGHRHKPIDGWRGVAASCVVIAHAVNYRLTGTEGAVVHYLQRLSEPMATTGVQIFFVISGFIITSLLLRERDEHNAINIPAFYARRLCRILPPLFAFYLTLIIVSWSGYINLPISSLITSAVFTCNIGIVDCDWWVAHTWSLAVEEQFYLVFPFAFIAIPNGRRAVFLAALLALCMVGAALQGPSFHGNFTSFGCIAAGALYATAPRLRSLCQRSAQLVPWLVVALLLTLVPLTSFAAIMVPLLPLLIVYLVFAGNFIGIVRYILETRVLQWLGLCSYSLYLWQQLFLARPDRYADAAAPALLVLPLAVIVSVWLVKKPFIVVGRRLSRKLMGNNQLAGITNGIAAPPSER